MSNKITTLKEFIEYAVDEGIREAPSHIVEAQESILDLALKIKQNGGVTEMLENMIKCSDIEIVEDN